MDIREIILQRRSIRRFRPDPVPPDLLREVLDLARWSPSWGNTQPWQVVITSGEATAKLREALLESPDGYGTDFDFPAAYTGIYDERRKDVGWQLYEAVGVTRGDREASAREMLRNYEFFGAPVGLNPLNPSPGQSCVGVLGSWIACDHRDVVPGVDQSRHQVTADVSRAADDENLHEEPPASERVVILSS